MSRETWLETYRTQVSNRDFALLEKASAILERNIIPHKDTNQWEPLRGICPSMLHFHGIWNWDSAFIAMGVSRWDKKLAQEQAEIFYRFQKEDGLFPDVIWEQKPGMEDRFGKPPVWPWAVAGMDRKNPDDAFLETSWLPLKKNGEFWRTKRFRSEDGLFVYGASTEGEEREQHIRYESGWDNAVRWDSGIESIYPVDLNCFMITFYRGMQYIACRLGKIEEAETYARQEQELKDAILNKLWDGERNCFADYNFAQKAFVSALSPASFMPLWVGIASPMQAAAMEKLAADPKKFYPGMPTVTYDDPNLEYDGYWRGPTWMNVAYFAVKGLYDYGFRKTAMEIRETMLKWMAREASIHENYDPTTGEPLRAADFSWSAAFAIEFILEFQS